jgi:hypothetical protein
MIMRPNEHTIAAMTAHVPWQQLWWRSLLLVMAIGLLSPIFALLQQGYISWGTLKTDICIPLAIWGTWYSVFRLSRGRIPAPIAFLLVFPLGYLLGDKIGPLFGGDDFIAEWVRHHAFWQAVGSGYLSAAAGYAFVDRFFRAAYYRGALETERRRIAEIERAQAVSELALLQAQIEPHFLFNTLSHVLSTVEHEPTVAKGMLEHLTSYLRATLQRSRKSQHCLGEEQDLVAALLAIAAMRLGPRLRYQICIDPSLRDLALPPLLLQPLVENAIRHGVEPAVSGGEIRVDAERVGEDLMLRVTDTGKGLAEGAPEGVGLSNVRARLAGLYGDRGRLSLFSNAALGVIAELRLPVQRETS